MSNWKAQRDRLLRKLQKKIVMYQRGTQTDCPTCGFDPVTGESSDPNCPTCGGIGYTYTDDVITVIDGNFRELSGESAVRRDLGNISSGAALLFCDAKYIAKIKLMYKIKVDNVYFTTYKNADGKLVMRKLRNPDGKYDRLEVTMKRSNE